MKIRSFYVLIIDGGEQVSQLELTGAGEEDAFSNLYRERALGSHEACIELLK